MRLISAFILFFLMLDHLMFQYNNTVTLAALKVAVFFCHMIYVVITGNWSISLAF